MTGKRILITGGAGYLGRFLVEAFYKENEIVVFSRDESKHWEMKQLYPKIISVLGDIRHMRSLREAADGCNTGLFCASMKHVNQVNENVDEAIQINVIGSRNSRRVAEQCRFDAACLISTDKSRLPMTLYGASKFIGGESFIWGSDRKRLKPRLSAFIGGNIANSTGSVIPTLWRAISNGQRVSLYSESMTRFFTTGTEMADLLSKALVWNGFNIMPKMRSFRVKDLFDIYRRKFGLEYDLLPPIGWVEREHEVLVSPEEADRTFDAGAFYASHHSLPASDPLTVGVSSNDNPMTPSDLEETLKLHQFYKPK